VTSGLHGRPTAVELLIAAREFLATDVLPATEGRVQFHTRVTIRVLETVERELTLGPAQGSEHARRLAALGYDSDQELVDAIRTGRHDHEIASLADALEPDVLAKLDVADPRYHK
jgi:hypothetical protein